jgi:UDP-N-acetylglucosamine transferase subunit ALG13
MTLPLDQQLPAETARTRHPRICLAASGGGHLRQLLELQPAWSARDHFFITENTALGRSLKGRVHFVPHVALGQGKLGHPLRMMAAAVHNLLRSSTIILQERPNVVISTGAGSTFFSILWARALGARVIIIESLARFRGLSAFSRVAGRLAHHRIVQAPGLIKFWPNAEVFDPLRILEEPVPVKSHLLVATVGATLPFPRLVDAVASLKRRGAIAEDVIIQRGVGSAAPQGVPSFETASYDEMLEIMRRARIVVCHGGTGALITALNEGCHVIAMPRRFADGEHYDDHQSEITEAFAARGLIQVAHSEGELHAALEGLSGRQPIVATSDYSDLGNHIRSLIDALAEHRWPSTSLVPTVGRSLKPADRPRPVR